MCHRSVEKKSRREVATSMTKNDRDRDVETEMLALKTFTGIFESSERDSVVSFHNIARVSSGYESKTITF